MAASGSSPDPVRKTADQRTPERTVNARGASGAFAPLFRHAWYTRLGYELDRVGAIDEDYPQLAAQLAGPADYRIYLKRREQRTASRVAEAGAGRDIGSGVWQISSPRPARRTDPA
jgi:hypothetical protein